MALFLGSLAAGVASGIVGPLLLLTVSALRTGAWPGLSGSDLESIPTFAALFGGVGIVVAGFLGFPSLALLRMTNRLNAASASMSGALMGLLAFSFFFYVELLRLPMVLFCVFLGAVAGYISLRVANGIELRSNKSLERTRGR
jgi:hypothetical protein